MVPSQLLNFSLDEIQDWVLWIDEVGIINYVNRTVEKALGIKKDEVMGSPISNFVNESQKDSWQKFKTKKNDYSILTGRHEFKGPSGNLIPIELTARRMTHEGKLLICLISNNTVTSENSVDENSQLLFQDILNYVGNPIFVKNREHKYTFMNKACCKAMGFTWQELKGKWDYDFFPKQESEIFWENDEKVFQTGEEDINEEKFTSGTQDTSTIVTSKRLYTDESGNQFIVGVSKDITPLKKAEEQLQRTNEYLEQKVQERTQELRKANQRLESRIEQLNYLNQKSHEFSRMINREELLYHVFNTFNSRFEESEISLIEYKDEKVNLISQTAGLEHSALLQGLGETFKTNLQNDRKLYCLSPWFEESEFESFRNNNLSKKGCYLWLPLIISNKLLAAIQIFTVDDYIKFFPYEESLLDTLTSQIAIALDNANHYEELEEKTRIQSELELARKIQAQYTPKIPMIPGVTIDGICMPANEVGGDYLDYFQNQHGDWVIVIADVCGKGIPAAMVMTSLRTCVRAEGRNIKSSKNLLIAVNDLMGPELQRERSFITCMCIIIDKDSSTMNFSRAGHPLLLSYNGSKKRPDPLPCKGLALGMVLGNIFSTMLEEVEVKLSPGDKFLAYTDGLDEAMNSEKQVYGQERILKLLEKNGELHPTELLDNILRDVDNYVDGQKQYDDLTLLAFEKY